MGQAADVGSRRNPALELNQVALKPADRELLNLNFDWSQFNLLLLASNLIGGHSFDLLSRKRRWNLLDRADEATSKAKYFFKCHMNCLRGTNWHAISVIGVGRDPQLYGPFIGFFGCRIELTEPGHASQNQWQD